MVMKSAIRHLATSDRRDIFLSALFEKTVLVWNAKTGEKLAELDTVLDFGGERLSVASSKDTFVAGAYTRHGVACYRLNGETLWHRKDLKGVQTIRISPQDKSVFCGFSDKPGHILDFETGETIERLRGVRAITYDNYEHCYVLDTDTQKNDVNKRLEVVDVTGHSIMDIKRETFAVMDFAFSPTHIAITECGGPVRFIPRKEPDKVVWYRPPKGKHVLRLAYSPKWELFFGVQYDYIENNYNKPTPSELLRFDLSLTEPTIITEFFEGWVYRFSDFGEHIITSEGLYINTLNGQVERKFAFPLTM